MIFEGNITAASTTFSLKVRTMFVLTATPVALSAGELDESVGAATSATVKFNVVLSFIPEKELPLLVYRSCINLHIVTLK